MAEFQVLLTATARTECEVCIEAECWDDAVVAFNALTPDAMHTLGWTIEPERLVADVVVISPSGERTEHDYPHFAPFEQLTLDLIGGEA